MYITLKALIALHGIEGHFDSDCRINFAVLIY